ncbi:hypothetical protein M011DRAFT_520605 [Sporormia fimetaria CBS 119925]|uniref:Impact N-terminal domain-containing protein n=1 Tax=Sporormia fimetaria CBS 119925 TaxID=1340428 RepID=A0A6A6V5X9_9PLEO|nr:hypothetical protein M011DRAFT_520605 [Sporormia fimetaria CBS 119925]
MASANEIQALLRFLTQDAKVPLAQAMGKVKELQRANLSTAPDIAKSDIGAIKTIFEDEKVAKQFLNAAKRLSKKRAAAGESTHSPTPAKKVKSTYGQPLTAAQFEESLALPEACKDEGQIAGTSIYTNRAPLVLAFAVTLLKYTMPEQPLSSRLSLAQAVVSVNSRSKAVSIGLKSGKSAEEEGWGDGQPIIELMGRDIRVMKRWGYDPKDNGEDTATQETLKEEPTGETQPALWGVDLEKLKQDDGLATTSSRNPASAHLPIYTAQSARAYLLKSFDTPPSQNKDTSSSRKTPGSTSADRERNLGLLLGALELLFESWASVLSKEDLDKRAWGWYVRVRPEVDAGAAGWGAKGRIKLEDILALRRPDD